MTPMPNPIKGQGNVELRKQGWEHVSEVLELQLVPPGLATVMRQAMSLAAAKETLDITGEHRKSGRRKALLVIFGEYDAREEG